MRNLKWISGFVVWVILVAVVQADLNEFFDYANGTSFNGTDQPGWVEAGDTTQNWRVWDNTLVCNQGSGTSYLVYTGEDFDIANGYTIMAKVQFRYTQADLSGWYSCSQSDGTSDPTNADGNRFYFYNGARYYNDSSSILGTNWGTKVFDFDTNYYIRQYAYYDSGDTQYHVKMWYSMGVIDADNPGTLFLDGSIMAPTGGFGKHIALIHNSTGMAVTYWDNLIFAQGDYIIPGETVHLDGDANLDGVVSAGDYASVQSNFGNTGAPGILGDANGDGVVSAGDYASVQANFGNVAPTSIAVPEPAAISLVCLGIATIIRRRKSYRL